MVALSRRSLLAKDGLKTSILFSAAEELDGTSGEAEEQEEEEEEATEENTENDCRLCRLVDGAFDASKVSFAMPRKRKPGIGQRCNP